MAEKTIFIPLILAVGALLCFLLLRWKPTLRFQRIRYPPEFLFSMERAYEVTGDVRGMLGILEHDFEKESIHKYIVEALKYLNESRYRDYETALELLSDESWEYMETYRLILEKEEMKSKRLEMKPNVPNSGTRKEEDEKE